jgi:hypothetical protein
MKSFVLFALAVGVSEQKKKIGPLVQFFEA